MFSSDDIVTDSNVLHEEEKPFSLAYMVMSNRINNACVLERRGQLTVIRRAIESARGHSFGQGHQSSLLYLARSTGPVWQSQSSADFPFSLYLLLCPDPYADGERGWTTFGKLKYCKGNSETPFFLN